MSTSMSAADWAKLSSTFGADTKTVEVEGTNYTLQECFVKALEVAMVTKRGLLSDEQLNAIWGNLGVMLPPGGSIDVGGTPYTRAECFEKAVYYLRKDSDSWNNLGGSLAEGATVKLHGILYTAKDCYVKAAETGNPAKACVWRNLSKYVPIGETVTVQWIKYTRQDCYVKALEKSPRDADVWVNLGSGMPTTTAASDTTTADVPVVVVSGKKYTRQNCYENALIVNPNSSVAWGNMGGTLSGDQTIFISGGPKVNRQECYQKALEINPNGSKWWGYLGMSLSSNGDDVLATVGDKKYTKQQCYERALEVDPKIPELWANMWSILLLASNKDDCDGDETKAAVATVNGVNYTADQCKEKALAINPKFKFGKGTAKKGECCVQ